MLIWIWLNIFEDKNDEDVWILTAGPWNRANEAVDVTMAVEMVGKWADDFMDGALTTTKPIPFDQMTGYQTAFRGARFTYRLSYWGAQDGGMVMQKYSDLYDFPRTHELE